VPRPETSDRRPIERATPDDVVSLATDVGPVPMQVGALLWLHERVEPDEVIARLAERIPSVPRLRQRLVRTPPGAGRPVWIDDPRFRLADHVDVHDDSAPCRDEDLLRIAAAAVTDPLAPDRPLWRMRYVPRLDGTGSALIVVFHHVLADGIGGLAVLASLVDGELAPAGNGFPHPGPARAELFVDALRRRMQTLQHPSSSLHRLRAAAAQLRPHGSRVAATSCSLNRPTGPRRALAVVTADLEPLHRAARAQGATVNDVLLTAVAGALHELLATRGEHVDRFVISVPMSARQHANVTSLGNDVGAVPVEIPATGEATRRLGQTALVTRLAKQTTRGSSMAILGPVFRLLARLGIFRWFINRQRLVHTFVTNLRGPAGRLSLVGTTVDGIAAIAVVAGNVTMSFAAISYAGTMTITVITDPDACPDLPQLRRSLHRQLDLLADRARP
jgi:WS/DGAT/MGAT family acyltransferase